MASAKQDDNSKYSSIQSKGGKKMASEMWPLEEDANDYLERHRILELFNNMTSQLIFNRPDVPKLFMIEMLEHLQKSIATHMDYPCLFDDSNIQAVYGMLDPTNSGRISLKQYKEAMTTIGVQGYDESPVGGEVDQITFETFLKEARMGLNKASATFHVRQSSTTFKKA